MTATALPAPPGRLRRVAGAVERFLLEPASARPLAVLRVGLAAVLLAQALAISAHLLELYGERGIVQWPIVHDLVPPGVPRVG